MGLIDRLRSYFGTTVDEPEQSGIDELRELLERRERDMELTAVFGEPYARTDVGEETIVFPYTVFNGDEPYLNNVKEFIVPDDGLADTESDLVRFLSITHSIGRDDVTFDHVAGVEGIEAHAEYDMGGDMMVLIEES